MDIEPDLNGKEIRFDNKTEALIVQEIDDIEKMLLQKNRKYGNSALKPLRIFSKASSEEQINVRIDDKISRVMQAESDEDEDVDRDLIGYLILRRVHRRMKAQEDA
jgi:hypothetical protein